MREDFLNKYFQSNPYPETPKDAAISGRLIKIEINSSKSYLTIERNFKSYDFELDNSKLTTTEVLENLHINDVIAITDKEIFLLAPCLKEYTLQILPIPLLRAWNLYLHKVREFFYTQNFLEIKTPSLVSCPGTEPSLDVFSTNLIIGSKTKKLFLPTSPELHLKKSLALGYEKIFEITNTFRNGEITERHQPEFTMLEWYRSYAHLDDIKNDVVDLVEFTVNALYDAGFECQKPEQAIDQKISELIFRHCDFEITPSSSLEDYKKCAEKNGVDISSASSIDDVFFLIMMQKIEPQLDSNNISFVNNYPPFQAALARTNKEGWGSRFEVYWQGFEIANAFNELNDPKIQKIRFQDDLDKKKQSGKEVVPLDTEFFQALEHGMPPSVGIALGLERLFMAIMGIKNISDLKLFPYKIV